MKQAFYILSGIMLSGVTLVSNAQFVNIPDANFKAALIANGVDDNVDGKISVAEAHDYSSVTGSALDLTDSNISDLTGIEAFDNLHTINVEQNNLTSLNLSSNTKLKTIVCSANQITSVNISSNTLLERLVCESNLLTSLDISSNPVLESLFARYNQLSILDLSANAALTDLYCSSNELTELDLSNNLNITNLECFYNLLDTLDLSNNSHLIIIECWHNQLTSLKVEGSDLEILRCGTNQLTTLDLSNCALLQILECSQSNLTSLDLSACTSLIEIGINEMPDLVNVCVWEMPFPPGGVIVTDGDSPNVVYSTACITGIENTPAAVKLLNIFPNPSQDHITVELPGYSNERPLFLSITDAGGRAVFEAAFCPGKNHISVKDLPRGMYLVRITGENKRVVASEKIIRQ